MFPLEPSISPVSILTEVKICPDGTGFATYLSLATAPPIFAWMSDLSPHDAEQRAFVLGFSIAFYYAVGEWYSSFSYR
jgi:hypothetical protein